METLKVLVDMVKDLPDLAIWLIFLYFFYKIFIVGSIWMVIKLAISKTHDVLVKRYEQPKLYEISGKLNRVTINGADDMIISELMRLRGKGTGIGSEYIHRQGAIWLKEAIDEKERRESPGSS